MKIIKTTILGIGFLLGASSITPTLAQTLEDALRYSQYNATGSARIMGIGGSQFAIGGDVSNISGNPAGLGFFRKSEFSFTPSYGNCIQIKSAGRWFQVLLKIGGANSKFSQEPF